MIRKEQVRMMQEKMKGKWNISLGQMDICWKKYVNQCDGVKNYVVKEYQDVAPSFDIYSIKKRNE